MCRSIGFGLTVGWMWLFFLSGPIFEVAVKLWPGNPVYFFQFFLLCVSLTYLLSGKVIQRYSLPVKKGFLLTAAVLMSVSSGLICLLPRINPGFGVMYGWFIYPFIAIGSCSLTLYLLIWMETFLTVSTMRDLSLTYTGSIVIASLLLFSGMILDNRTGILAVIIIPWLSLLLILRQLPVVPPSTTDSDKKVKDFVRQSFPSRFIWLIIFFYMAGGMMFNLVTTGYHFVNYFWISNISYMVVVILAACAMYFIPEFDLRLLSRPVLLLLAAGFILFPFLYGKYAIISFLLLEAGFALFDMYTFLIFVYIARTSLRPLPILGLGMFWITFSMFGGGLAYTIFSRIQPRSQLLNSLAITAGLVTMLASFLFQENSETFSGWKPVNVSPIPKTSPTTFERSVTNKTVPMSNDILLQSEHEELIRKSNLTPRETEILFLILKGRNNPFIRENLNISPNTLKFHIKNIYQKLAINSRQELLSLFEENIIFQTMKNDGA